MCNPDYNCRQTGIESSKHVYSASMSVKIEHTVGVPNQDIFQNAYSMVMSAETLATSQNCKHLCFCLSELNDIHGQLNTIEFCYKFYRICHLGRLPTIIIDILFVLC